MTALMQAIPSTLSPRSAATESIANLGTMLIIVGSAVFIVVTILVVMAALRRRGTLMEHAPINAGGGTAWLQIGGLIAPAIILAFAFLATLRALGQFPVEQRAWDMHAGTMMLRPASAGPAGTDPVVPDIQITAEQWWWNVRYQFSGSNQAFNTANEVHVPVGQTVRFAISSNDVIHSFWIPQLHPKIDAIPGRTNTITIFAGAAGTYRGECAEYCGAQHAHMAFTVIAESPDKFQDWLKQMAEPAAAPADSDATLGQRLFMQQACSFCHSVRGTDARGRVAPDLTHLASRETIAAGLLRNNRGNLQAWVVNAPSLKPGTRMPPMNRFNGKELNAIVSYLEGLR